MRLRLLGERQEVLGVPPSELVGLARGLEPLGSRTRGSSRASSSEGRASESRLRRRLLSRSDCSVSGSASRDLLRGLVGAAAGEDGEASEELLLFFGEEVVRPLDRRAQGLLARIGVALALEQVETLREPLEQLLRAEERGAGSGELERERELVEAEAELGHRLGRRERRIDGACAGTKSATPSGSASGGTG